MKGKKGNQLWRRFGYVILIIVQFGVLLLWISLRVINALRRYVKCSKECLITYPNTSKLVKKKNRCALFSQPTSQYLDIWWNTPPSVWFVTPHSASGTLCKNLAKLPIVVRASDWRYGGRTLNPVLDLWNLFSCCFTRCQSWYNF